MDAPRSLRPADSLYPNSLTKVYRFWPGRIPHANSIRISTEHGNNNDTPANYSSLVYYYFLP